nr:immunoglobulin heavy chain junction region [Mus musculus]
CTRDSGYAWFAYW